MAKLIGRDPSLPQRSLPDWLSYLEALHPKTIALGLERVQRVRDAAQLRPAFPIITVGGTNGKGSTCAMIESILVRAGYRVGGYSSPHLLRYNERVKLNGVPVDDAQLCQAFAAIEAARGETLLTYFEFGTLAALWLFAQQQIEVAVLEVGLGGRLDAVNAFDPDCAVVTNVDLDHMDYLGDNVETIGREKAGIYRGARAAIFGDTRVPQSIVSEAQRIGARLMLLGHEFGFERQAQQWNFWRAGANGIEPIQHYALPFPALRGSYQLNNAATALCALAEVRSALPISLQHIKRGLLEVELSARFQVLPGQPTVVLDVAHNPHAAAALAENVKLLGTRGRRLAVFGMLKDKDIGGVIEHIAPHIDRWYVGSIDAPRGASAATLQEKIATLRPASEIETHRNPAAAYAEALRQAQPDDKILVFGSFYTVAEVMQYRHAHAR